MIVIDLLELLESLALLNNSMTGYNRELDY